MNVCICTELDGRGKSVCGVECKLHPINGKCPDCEQETHSNRRCFSCERKHADRTRPKSCAAMQKAYTHIINTFQALERWKRLERRNPNTPDAEVDAAIATLRNIWGDKIIPWHIAEDEHHNWHE